MNRVYILTLLFLTLSTTYSQTVNEVYGTIKLQDNSPAIGVNIILENTNIGSSTDLNGNFSLSKIKISKGVLILSGVGFKTTSFPIDFSNTSDLKLNLFIELKSEQLSEVNIIGASNSSDKIKKQGFAVAVVSTELFLNESTNLNQILASTPGVIVRENGGLGSSFDLSLNGLSGNQIRYYYDGIPMEDFGSALSLNNFSANLIENIEVFKGVVPINLSSDALGGAINIITTNPRKKVIDVSYSYGSFNTHRASVFAQNALKNGVFFRISSYINHSDNDYTMHDVPVIDEIGNVLGTMEARRFHDRYTSGMIAAKLGVLDKKFADELSINVTYALNKNEFQHPEVSINKVYGGLHTKNNTTLGSIVYKKDFNSLKVKGYGLIGHIKESTIDTLSRKYNWNQEYEPTNNTGEYYGQKSIFDLNDDVYRTAISAANKFNEQHTIATSFSLNHLNRVGSDKLNPYNIAFTFPNWINKKNLGVSYEFKTLDKKISTNMFAKNYWYTAEINTEEYVDEQDKNVTTNVNFKAFGYGFASSYRISDKLRAKASYEKAYRLPEPNEILGNGVLILANPDLREEQSDNINLGFTLNRNNTTNGFKLESNFFYRCSKGFIRPRTTGILTQYINEENVRTVGVEASSSIVLKKIVTLSLNATYQDIRDRTKYDEGFENWNYGHRITNIPYLFGNLRAGVNIPLKNVTTQLNTNWNMQYIHEFFLSHAPLGTVSTKNVIPSQFINDFNIDYSFSNGKYNIGFTAKNILNTKAYDNFKIEKPGRAFYLKIRYNIQ